MRSYLNNVLMVQFHSVEFAFDGLPSPGLGLVSPFGPDHLDCDTSA